MTAVDGFTGNWTYRSFYNNPNVDAAADDIVLARAGLTLMVGSAPGASMDLEAGGVWAGLDLCDGCEVSGKVLIAPGWELTVSGIAQPGEPPAIRYRGIGVEGTPTAGWIYDYLGYLSPCWPNGVGQLPTIVGTVIRTVSHPGFGGQVSEAGVTLSFIAVSRDHPVSS